MTRYQLQTIIRILSARNIINKLILLIGEIKNDYEKMRTDSSSEKKNLGTAGFEPAIFGHPATRRGDTEFPHFSRTSS